MPPTLPGKLLALQWALDHWDLTEGPIAEATDKQANYILNLIDQAQGKVPSQTLDDMMMAAGLPLLGAVGVSTMKDAILDLHWKKASGIINALKSALGPGAGLVGKATPNQLGFVWKLVQVKDAQSVEALFLGLGYDIPVSKTDLEKFNLSKADASKAIDALQALPAATAVAQVASPQEITDLEDLLVAKGLANRQVQKIAKSFGITIMGGNISMSLPMKAADVKAVTKKLKALPDLSAATAPASQQLRKDLVDLFHKKGGADNDKAIQVLKKFSIPFTTHPPLSVSMLDPELQTKEASLVIDALKKLKMHKASRKQVAEVLALLSQLGPAVWKKSPLSKKWAPQDLRSTSLLKRTSVEMKAFISDLKKELVKAH